MQALLLLNRLRFRAAVRHRLRELLSIRGLLFIVTICLFLIFIHRSVASDGVTRAVAVRAASLLDKDMLGLSLLIACVFSALTSTRGALQFSQAESNTLLSSPLPRSAIVMNKCLSYIVGASLSALLLAVLLPGWGASRPRWFLATLSSLVVVQLASTAMSMGGHLAGKHLIWLPRRSFWLLVAVLGVAVLLTVAVIDADGIARALGSAAASVNSAINNSGMVRLLLVPFSAVAGLYLPDQSMSELIVRGAATIALVVVLLVSIIFFDAHLLDESADAGQAADRRWQKMRRSGQVWRQHSATSQSRKPPRFMGAVGALAWAQGIRLFRTSATLLLFLALGAVICGVMLGLFASTSLPQRAAPLLFFGAVFLLPKMLVFDFRGSFDGIERLQSLPVSANGIALAQLATPVLTSSALWWLMVAGAAPFVENFWMLVAAAALAVPFNVLLYATENLGFLLAPSRPVPVGRMDFDFLGRTLVDFVAKCVVLGAAFALAATVFVVSVRYSASFAIGASLALLVALLLCAVSAVARAFARFDVTRVMR